MNDRPHFQTKDGTIWRPQGLLWAKICAVYGATFVAAQCEQVDLWLMANPRRQKTHRGMPRFLNNWMSKAAKEQVKRPQQVSVNKDWSDVPPDVLKALQAKYDARGKA